MVSDACAKCVRVLVFVFNGLFFLSGIGLIILAGFIKAKDWNEGMMDLSDLHFFTITNLAIATGVIIVIVSSLGCLGAISQNKRLLLAFFIFILIVFILEIATGAVAYAKRDTIEENLRKEILERIPSKFYTDPAIRAAMDLVQKEFSCCGVDGASTYNRAGQTSWVPKSCCKKTSTICKQESDYTSSLSRRNRYNWDAGCYSTVREYLMDNLMYIGITGFVFCFVIQLLGMIFSMILYCQKEDGNYKPGREEGNEDALGEGTEEPVVLVNIEAGTEIAVDERPIDVEEDPSKGEKASENAC